MAFDPKSISSTAVSSYSSFAYTDGYTSTADDRSTSADYSRTAVPDYVFTGLTSLGTAASVREYLSIPDFKFDYSPYDVCTAHDYTVTSVPLADDSFPIDTHDSSPDGQLAASVPRSGYTSPFGKFEVIDLASKLSINPVLSREAMQKVFWGLGKDNKWMECIDEEHQRWGRLVYDQGLHGGPVEPGYIGSMEKACEMVAEDLGSQIDADWFLRLHQCVAGHFKGAEGGTLMGQEKVGVFRNTEDKLQCTYKGWKKPTLLGRCELMGSHHVGQTGTRPNFPWGQLEDVDDNTVRLHYQTMSSDQVKAIFNQIMRIYYQEIAMAKSLDERFTSVAVAHQWLERLHPPRDGATRANLLILQKLLTENGIHPSILKSPHVSTTFGTLEWKTVLYNGLLQWERERAKTQEKV